MDTPTGWGGATHNEEQWIYEKGQRGVAKRWARPQGGRDIGGRGFVWTRPLGGEAPTIGNNEHVRKEGGVASRGHTHLRREPPHNAEH